MSSKKYIKKLTSWSVFLLDILYPIQCLNCKNEGKYLCKKCLNNVPINNNSTCPICHKNSSWGKICHNCKTKTSLDGVFSSYNYKQALIKKIISTNAPFVKKVNQYHRLRPILRKSNNQTLKLKTIRKRTRQDSYY